MTWGRPGIRIPHRAQMENTAQNIQIIILAGGKGKRMNMEVPKALVPFHGRPMIDYVLSASIHSGIPKKPIIVVGYMADAVKAHVGDRATYAIQDEQLGTGHAVQVSENKVPEDVDNVLVLYADAPAVTGSMLANLAMTHIQSGKVMTMATVKIPSFDDWYQIFYKPFSRIIRRADGSIERSVEFRDANDEEKKITEINPCYFCFNKKWLFDNLAKIKNENAQGEYYLTDLVGRASEINGIASVSISPEEALGVNSIEELERLEKIISNPEISHVILLM